MLKYYKDEGIVIGSENAGDFGMAYLDFLENRHSRVPGKTIPIWPLVYHDAAFCARYPGGNTSTVGEAGDMLDILWGYNVMWATGDFNNWKNSHEAFKKSLFVDTFHEKIATAEMTNHKFHGADLQVEQTEFSTGLSVLANFAGAPRTVEGKTVPANDYLILD